MNEFSKKIKMPGAYTILMGIIVIVAFLTWIIPSGKYVKGVYSRVPQTPQGLLQIFSAPIEGFYDAIAIALFVLVIGGFLGIVIQTGAIDAAIGSVIRKFKGKESLFIPIMMIFFGIGGTTFGMAEETIAFYPILIPVFVAAGYDVVTAVAVILLGAGTGVLCSTVNPFATGAASEAANISLGVGIGLRAMMFFILEFIAILYVMSYAKKVRNDPSKSVIFSMKKENEDYFLHENTEIPRIEKRQLVVLIIFCLTFILMILGVIPWGEKFHINFFKSINDFLANFPFLGIYSTSSSLYWQEGLASAKSTGVPLSAFTLGDWYFGQMTVLFFFSAILIGKVFGMTEDKIIDIFIRGSKDLLGVALIIGLSRGIKVVMSAGGMDATVLFFGENSLRNFSPALFTILSYVFYIPMSFLIPSTSGLAGATMPIMGPLAGSVFSNTGFAAESGKALVITAYQSASGIVNLFTPTSGVVMGALAIARVPYPKWLRYLLKLLIIYFFVTIILLFLGVFFS